MQGAIVGGFFGNPPTSSFSCSTSNCTWPGAFASLGVESTCANATEQSKRVCSHETGSFNGRCNYTTPGGLNISSISSGGNDDQPGIEYTILNLTSAIGYQGFGYSADATGHIFQFVVYRALGRDDDKYGSGLNSTQDVDFEVIECNLTFVAQVYTKVSVHSNSFEIAETANFNLGYGKGRALNVQDNSYWDFNATGDMPPSLSRNRTFTVNRNDAYNLGGFPLSFLSSVSALGPAQEIQGTSIDTATAALWTGNITQLSENMASAMTSYIRDGRNATPAYGIAYQKETYIHVRWAWLALPVGIVLLSAAMLIASIILSKQQTLWKSSSLALLFHALKGLTLDETNPRTRKQMEIVAEKMTAELGREGTLEFVKKT